MIKQAKNKRAKKGNVKIEEPLRKGAVVDTIDLGDYHGKIVVMCPICGELASIPKKTKRSCSVHNVIMRERK